MDDLAEHIQQTFSAFMGYEEADIQLTLWCIRKRESECERHRDYYRRNSDRIYANTKAWRKANPDKQRALNTRQQRARRARYPEKYRAIKQRYRDKHREHVREVNRRNQAARRARLKAQKRGEAA